MGMSSAGSSKRQNTSTLQTDAATAASHRAGVEELILRLGHRVHTLDTRGKEARGHAENWRAGSLQTGLWTEAAHAADSGIRWKILNEKGVCQQRGEPEGWWGWVPAAAR